MGNKPLKTGQPGYSCKTTMKNKIYAVSQDGKWEADVTSFGQAVTDCNNAIVHCFDSVHMIYLCSFENGHKFDNEDHARHALSLR